MRTDKHQNTKRRKRKKRNEKKQLILLIIHVAAGFILLLFLLVVLLDDQARKKDFDPIEQMLDIELDEEEPASDSQSSSQKTGSETENASASQETEAGEAANSHSSASAGGTHAAALSLDDEDLVYTFLQGPKSWKSKVDWSGSWSTVELVDSTFGSFGCGMCCMANIYDTFSPYECSPMDMYYYAQESSDYHPTSGFGAIDWDEMRDSLQKAGFSCKLGRKNSSYEGFQKLVSQSLCSIILVSSYNDSTYWENTEGHYVTIWLYDEETDTVFLGDSGNPDHNRQRIPLEYLYKAMKTSSNYQFLMVNDYTEENNSWKQTGISDKWNAPKYYQKKVMED